MIIRYNAQITVRRPLARLLIFWLLTTASAVQLPYEQINAIIPFGLDSSKVRNKQQDLYATHERHYYTHPEEALESRNVTTMENDIIVRDHENVNPSSEMNDDDAEETKSEFSALTESYYSRDARKVRSKSQRTKREVNVGKKWPSHIIPYEIDPDAGFLSNETAILRDVFDEFEKYTCIRFVPHTNEVDFLYIRSVESRGCLSYIGHQGGRQDIFLRRPNCLYYPGTVMHETMHSIGFYHEHSRPDRENYIDILYYNIKPEKVRNFDVEPRALSLGSPYDYLSLMHYSALTFSVDADHLKYTIVPKKLTVPVDELGQRRGFSQVDIEQIRRFYECEEDEHDTKPAGNIGRQPRINAAPSAVISPQNPPALFDDLCDSSFIPSAAINFFGSVFLFRGDKYWKLEYNNLVFKAASGYPRSNEVGWGTGTPSDPDAAFSYYLFVYMFKDGQSWILGPNRPAKGPIAFQQLFPQLPQSIPRWDASFTRDNWIHFIKGQQYWQLELLTNELLGPLLLPPYFPSHIDAMTELSDKRIMIISGNSVYLTQVNDVTKFERGFPHSIADLVCTNSVALAGDDTSKQNSTTLHF